jgi:hypothetical protein
VSAPTPEEGYADTAKPKVSNLLKIIAGITAAALAGLFLKASPKNRSKHKKGEDDGEQD